MRNYFMSEDFDKAFSNEEEQETQVETTEEQTEETSKAEQQGETASPEDESKAQAETSKAESEDEKPKNWEYAAYKDERQKRQELEKQIAANNQQMQQMMMQMQQGAQPQPQQSPDFYSDPEKYIQSLTQSNQKQMQDALFAQSEEMMRIQFPDYDEKREQFLTLVQNDPSLRDAALNHPAPATFIYNTVKQHEQQQKLSEIGDVEKWREEERKRIREEIEAEAKKRGQEILNESSLADARGVKGDSPLSQEDVFDKTFS